MSNIRDLLGVASSGLTAKLTRTLLIMLGPIIGVSAIVAAVGLTESAKGDLQQTLSQLGTNLIKAEAAGSFGTQDPTFPEDVVVRVESLSTVESATAVINIAGVVTSPYSAADSYYTAFPIPVIAADSAFLDVMDVGLVSGRWINSFDVSTAGRAAVIGAGLADEFAYIPGTERTISVGGFKYGVVGVMDRVVLEPTLDNAVVISPQAADRDFDTGLEATTLYVRSDPAQTLVTEAALPVAINLGGNDEVNTSVPTDALESAAAADTTLQAIVALMGGLALIVGGVGIANVMSISVIQRSSEIGIRRALGHGRGLIAGQFMLESVVVGLFGGMAGAGVGSLVVEFVSRSRGWVVVLRPGLLLMGVAAAIGVSVVAGLYPSTKAARLEPLETLRLG